MNITSLILGILCSVAIFNTELHAQLSEEDRLSTQSPYITDSRSVKLIGIQVQNLQNNRIEIDGQTYHCFDNKTAALDYFRYTNVHQDYTVIYINDASFEEETHEIRRKILRKAYYDTPMEREIFSIHQIN